MKQLINSLEDGSSQIIDLPIPKIGRQEVLIKTVCSLISSGTEKMLVDFGKSNYLNKALKQPEKVSQVVEKIKTDGFLNSINAVKTKLEMPITLGYSNAGVVVGVGRDVKGIKVGDRVISNGPHAEFVSVPQNLCALIPDNLPFEKAVFTIISSIGLQGVRLSKPTLGETFVVSGLGLIGLITIQILRANGCKVIGIDPDQRKCDIAKNLNFDVVNPTKIDDMYSHIISINNKDHIDGVIITATTKSNDPLDLAAKVSRKRGRIILIGQVGLELKRDLFYKKEITFQVSCSYGPGRYDDSYEKKGIDYPLGFVRWTQQRNMTAVLDLINKNLINVDSLISHKFEFCEFMKAYQVLETNSSALGIVFNYEDSNNDFEEIIKLRLKENKSTGPNNINVSCIGCGNYASRVILPILSKQKVNLISLGANNGLNPVFFGKKFGFNKATTNINRLINEEESNIVLITTRHDSHAELIKKCLDRGKNIFVEKPLCLSLEELEDIKLAYQESSIKFNRNPILMVGFNRRFAPLIVLLKNQLNKINDKKCFIYNCNAGFIEPEHWIHDPKIGGGRFIGEACHFIDLLCFLADDNIENINIAYLNSSSKQDTFSIQITFKEGSLGIINYFSNGNKNYPKEILEVFSGGKIFKLNNYIELKAWGSKSFRYKKYISQDKGQKKCINKFINAVEKGEKSPIPIDDIFDIQRKILEANKL